MLFNGFSVTVDPANRAKLTQSAGVKAVYPVAIIDAPTAERGDDITPNLVAAINLTGAKTAQDVRGLSGTGIKVGIIDTGIDIDHPAFGGGGAPLMTPFPSARVVGLRPGRRQLQRAGTGAH